MPDRRRTRTAHESREMLIGCIGAALGERFARTTDYDGPLVRRIAAAFVIDHAASVDDAVDGLVAGTLGYEEAVDDLIPDIVACARSTRPDIEWRDHARALYTTR